MIYLYADHRGHTYARKIEIVTYEEKHGGMFTRLEIGRPIFPGKLCNERGLFLQAMIESAHTLQQQILYLILDEERIAKEAVNKDKKSRKRVS